jgi:hypothetical protein
MPTFTPNMGFGIPTTGQRPYGTTIGGDLGLIDGSVLGSLFVQTTEVPSATLNVEISAGNYQKQNGVVGTYAGIASVAMTASTTNYLYIDLTAGSTLVINTTGFPTTAHVRIATVVTGASTITSITDARVAFTVAGSFVDGANLTFGTVTGTQIGTAANQKLAFFGATPVVQQTFGVKTAGTSYTTNEQTMIQDLWNLVRTLGLGS